MTSEAVSKEKTYKMIFPISAAVLAILLNYFIPNNPDSNSVDQPYFTYFLAGLVVIFIVVVIISNFNERIKNQFIYKSSFLSFVIIVVTIVSLLSAKTDFLPIVYFPTMDKILSVFVTEWPFLIKCAAFYDFILSWNNSWRDYWHYNRHRNRLE